MSRPDEAATGAGIVRVFSGSSRPSVGFNRRLAMPVLACIFLKSKIADAGRLAPRAGGRRDRDERLERTGHRQAFAYRRVDVVEKVGRRIRDVQVHGFRRVDGRAAAERDDRVEGCACAKSIASRNDSSVGSTRTRSYTANLTPLRVERLANHRPAASAHDGIRHDQDALDAEVRQFGAHFTCHPDAVADARRRHLERDLVIHPRLPDLPPHHRPARPTSSAPRRAARRTDRRSCPPAAPSRRSRPSAWRRRPVPASCPRCTSARDLVASAMIMSRCAATARLVDDRRRGPGRSSCSACERDRSRSKRVDHARSAIRRWRGRCSGSRSSGRSRRS